MVELLSRSARTSGNSRQKSRITSNWGTYCHSNPFSLHAMWTTNKSCYGIRASTYVLYKSPTAPPSGTAACTSSLHCLLYNAVPGNTGCNRRRNSYSATVHSFIYYTPLCRDVQYRYYNPAANISPYPKLMITAKAMILAGIPLVKKCLTCKYRTPVSGTSIMIAATQPVSKLPYHSLIRHGTTHSYSETQTSASPSQPTPSTPSPSPADSGAARPFPDPHSPPRAE